MKRFIGLLSLLIVYAIAIAGGIFAFIGFSKLGLNDYLAILLADIAATIVVWLSGVILKTASAYDPYWSL